MNQKKVYMYDIENNLIKVFNSTKAAAIYFGCDTEYLYHNLKYCKRKRKGDKWYILRRHDIPMTIEELESYEPKNRKEEEYDDWFWKED